MACGILVPPPGIDPVPPAMEAWSSNHWTTRESPRDQLLAACENRLLNVQEFGEPVVKHSHH